MAILCSVCKYSSHLSFLKGFQVPGVSRTFIADQDHLCLFPPLNFSLPPAPTRLGTKGQDLSCLPQWHMTFPCSLLTCKLWRTFKKSFIPVRCSTSWKIATSRVGMMAIERVRITRANRDHLRFRNPWKETESGQISVTGKTGWRGSGRDLGSTRLRNNKEPCSLPLLDSAPTSMTNWPE